MTGKLVRDRIPEVDRRRGGSARFRRADPDEMTFLLFRKITEEYGELAGASVEDIPHEAADLIEAVLAYAEHLGHSAALVDHVRRLKLKELGGFGQRQVLQD